MKTKITSFFNSGLFFRILRNKNETKGIKKGGLYLKFVGIIIIGICLIVIGGIKGRIGIMAETDNIQELIVKYKDSERLELVIMGENENTIELLRRYESDPQIEHAEPNYSFRAAIVPSDTYYSNQWYLDKIKAPSAWNITRESADIVIAVVDSGVQINHPDLRDNIWTNKKEIPNNKLDDDKNGYIDDISGWDFVNNTADPSPKFNGEYTESGILHGTIVAGIIAASGNNASGIAGVTWRTQLMGLKVLDDKGEGDTFKVIQAINYAVKNGADIINLSFVGSGYSQELDRAIERAYQAGIIVVAAAGNEQEQGHGQSLDEAPLYPACHDGLDGENRVIGVAATDSIDQKALFSSYGFKCVDIAAPGVSIYGTVVYAPDKYIDGKSFNSYYGGYWSGTSMATPMVSSAIALIEATNPKLTRDEVIDLLLTKTDNINRLNPNYINQLGNGRINLYRSVQAAKTALDSKLTKIIIAPFSNSISDLKLTNEKGDIINQFQAYSSNFRGGATVAAADINGDGNDEIITGSGNGGGPHVRIFSSAGELQEQFFAYTPEFRGGVNVATGDIDGDGRDEIITGAGSGGGPQVRIFTGKGKVLGQFFAYDKNFRGGVNVAAGDIDGDGRDEIITGAGSGGGPQVRIFTGKGRVLGQFFAYDKNFRGGVRLATGDIDGGARGYADRIITAPGQGGGPHIKIFDEHANLISHFFAYDQKFRGGVGVSTGDINNDGFDEVITGAGAGGAPHVRVFTASSRLLGSFYAFAADFDGGVNVASIKIKQ